jgi:hypothetical protein
MSDMAYSPIDPVSSSVLPPQQHLSRNPQLPQHPLGAYTDAQFEAQNASLRAEIARRHQDILRQLGYVDDNGNFVMGDVETEANRQRSDLTRNMGLAREGVTNEAQRQGTLFSGRRGTETGRAEFPYAQGISALGVSVPRTLSDLYEQAGGLVDEYTLRQNQLLADAATRAAAGIITNPGGAGAPSAQGGSSAPSVTASAGGGSSSGGLPEPGPNMPVQADPAPPYFTGGVQPNPLPGLGPLPAGFGPVQNQSYGLPAPVVDSYGLGGGMMQMSDGGVQAPQVNNDLIRQAAQAAQRRQWVGEF